MNFATLPKEQKQYLIIGLLVGVGVVVLSIFGIKISLSSIAESKDELQTISDKIEKADRALSKSKATSEQYIQTASELKALLNNVPPSRNYYSWATEIIYSQARNAELEIDAIDEIAFSRVESGKDEAGVVRLDSYALRITAHGGYSNLKELLGSIEKNHPMARIIGLEISSGKQPAIHDIQLIIQWPFNSEAIIKIWENLAEQNRVDEQKSKLAQLREESRLNLQSGEKTTQASPHREKSAEKGMLESASSTLIRESSMEKTHEKA